MLGGGVFVTQNKVLPGSYVNFVNTSRATGAIGERGTVAIALPLGTENEGKVIELTRSDFVQNSDTILGIDYDAAEALPLREIFCHANKVYLYDLGESGSTTAAAMALEPYDFNVLCVYSGNSSDVGTYTNQVKTWRDTIGKKCQVVYYGEVLADHESAIKVKSTISDEGADEFALVAWVSGALAGCKVNESCTNMLYDGELTIVANESQEKLEEHIQKGEFVFHNVYGEIRVLEDINSLVTTTADKGEDFKNNQTIRVIDQIANDIAKLFNTKYLGRIPNNASGRVSLWGDIVAHHKELERIQAIENFDPTLVTVEQGATKKAVVVNDVITVTNCMSQLYMTIVVQ